MERSREALKFRDAIYEQFARIGKAVSSPKRLELLDLLSQAPRTVEKLAKGINQSVANTSQHLQVLRSARLVDTEKDGLYVHYFLADEAVSTFFLSLRSLAERRLAEVRQTSEAYMSGSNGTDAIDSEELIEMVRRGEATLLDLRTPEEFKAGHIPGARNVPAASLEQQLAELPRNKTIVTYCRGPYCVFGIEAERLLRDQGFNAYRLPDGVPEWKLKGYDIESSHDSDGDRS